jgi:hypothetical protein
VIRQLDDVLAFAISLDRDFPTPFRLQRERLQDRLGTFLLRWSDLQRHAQTGRRRFNLTWVLGPKQRRDTLPWKPSFRNALSIVSPFPRR